MMKKANKLSEHNYEISVIYLDLHYLMTETY